MQFKFEEFILNCKIKIKTDQPTFYLYGWSFYFYDAEEEEKFHA